MEHTSRPHTAAPHTAAPHSPPDNELPVGVPLDVLLVRTADLAVAVTGAQVFSSGMLLTVVARLRVEPPELGRHAAHRLFSMHGESMPGEEEQRFLLGLELADGGTAANVMGGQELRPSSGGGGGTSYHQTYWLTPVPPDGRLTFVCACAALGVPETRAVVEGLELTTVSTRATVLWPDPPRPTNPAPAVAPRLPAGWFARHAGQG